MNKKVMIEAENEEYIKRDMNDKLLSEAIKK